MAFQTFLQVFWKLGVEEKLEDDGNEEEEVEDEDEDEVEEDKVDAKKMDFRVC